MRISDWSSDVCSSDLAPQILRPGHVTRVAKRTRGGEHRRTRIGREEHTMRNSLGGAMCAAMLAGCLGAGTAAAQVSDDAVRIGVLTDMSGPYVDINGPGSIAAVQMAVEDFGGTVLGKPIEVLTADHQNKTDVGANVARTWYDQDGVDLVTNMANSAVALAVQRLAIDKDRLSINTAAATSDLTGQACSPNGRSEEHTSELQSLMRISYAVF